MAVVKNMMVRAGADFSAITKQASKASNSMRGMQNSVSRSCNAMSKAAAGLKKAFAAVGVAVSLGALVNAAKDAAAAYDEQVQNEVRLAQAEENHVLHLDGLFINAPDGRRRHLRDGGKPMHGSSPLPYSA